MAGHTAASAADATSQITSKMTTATGPQRLPPPPSLRLVTIHPKTLLGFKACPGPNGSRLLNHTSTAPGDASTWSGIYVQLSLSQAISYVPNQYDRGESTCCICQIRTRESLQVAISDDPVMAFAGVSSSDKARRALLSVQQTPALDWEIPPSTEDDFAIVA